jgi:hypothetical protein
MWLRHALPFGLAACLAALPAAPPQHLHAHHDGGGHHHLFAHRHAALHVGGAHDVPDDDRAGHDHGDRDHQDRDDGGRAHDSRDHDSHGYGFSREPDDRSDTGGHPDSGKPDGAPGDGPAVPAHPETAIAVLESACLVASPLIQPPSTSALAVAIDERVDDVIVVLNAEYIQPLGHGPPQAPVSPRPPPLPVHL